MGLTTVQRDCAALMRKRSPLAYAGGASQKTDFGA